MINDLLIYFRRFSEPDLDLVVDYGNTKPTTKLKLHEKQTIKSKRKNTGSIRKGQVYYCPITDIDFKIDFVSKKKVRLNKMLGKKSYIRYDISKKEFLEMALELKSKK